MKHLWVMNLPTNCCPDPQYIKNNYLRQPETAKITIFFWMPSTTKAGKVCSGDLLDSENRDGD